MSDDLSDEFMQQLLTERQKVDVATHDFSVRELVRMMEEDELNVAPAYQRMFRWNDKASSLFVESVFLGLPVPPIFVATNVGFQWEVVDGLQRLSSLAHFLAAGAKEAAAVNRTAPLVLTGLEKLDRLNGRTYESLPKNLKVHFGRQPLQVVSLTDKSNLEVRFDVFERLNRGGLRLTAQEVRAVVYRGDFNLFIEELALNEDFNALLKLKEGSQDDGTRVEQVLKFFAYKNHSDIFDGKVERFLNSVMGLAQSGFDYVRERTLFEKASAFLREVCDGPYLRSGTKTTPLVQFEACLVAIAQLYQEGKEPVVPRGGWIEDEELRASSGGGSNSRRMLDRRLTRAKDLFSGQA
ncbi:GmrSD restriction endonuclease domain-containing protein [Streptomyces griseorubiginosus]|uniref:GmrSD restriction endonuclease domain-containing protein n=1 Tax=Streptomyces griseorubiginosus TaxID=67304 RepID=UPI0036EDD444